MSGSQLDVLDPRADNRFYYDKDEQCWVLATTWSVWLHKVRDPKDKYELRKFRAARRFDSEPTADEFNEFAETAKKGLADFRAAGTWSGDLVDGEPVTWRFNRSYIKDFREGA